MSELQWNLLNTNAPAQIAASFKPMESYLQGAEGAQKLRMNELAMEKTQSDIQYNPMKVMSQVSKNALAGEKTKVEMGLKELELGAGYAQKVAVAPPGQALAMALQNSKEMIAITGKTPEEGLANEQKLIAMHQQLGEEGFKAQMADMSMKIKDRLTLMQGREKLAQGQQGLGIKQQVADQGAVANGIKQQNANNYGVAVNKPQFLNTGGALVQNPGTGGGNVYEPIPITESPNVLAKAQVQEIGANRPHVANLMANGWMPPQRVTKPMLDAIEAAATEAEKQGLPFNPDDIRAYEFQAQKNQATGRTAGSRMVIARKENIDTADKLISRMQETAKQLDFSNIKIAAIADKWVKGQMQDPVLSRYMTQRADALFALGNALKQNGLTDKAIQIEEEAAHPTVSPAAFDAWFKAQKEALSDAKQEMEKDYNPIMPNKQGNKPAAQTIGRFQIEVE